MTNASSVHGSFTVERRFPVAAAKVFAACADPALKRSWFAESDTHDVEVFESDFRVGGTERLAYRFRPNSPLPGAELTSHGLFHDIVDQQRIVSSSHMAVNGRTISVALETIELAEVRSETILTLTFQGVFLEGSDGPVMREQGWNVLLDQLGRAVAG